MCCGGYFGSFPDPGGYVISSLEKGDEITLSPGMGYPKSDKAKTLVIYSVYGFSALCTDGTRLGCRDGNGVTKTGRKVNAKAGVKVYLVLLGVQIQKVGNWFNDLAETIKLKIWWIGRRIKKLRGGKKSVSSGATRFTKTV